MILKVKIHKNNSEGENINLVKSHRDNSKGEKFIEMIPEVRKFYLTKSGWDDSEVWKLELSSLFC
jgi:hypothetical protein